MENQGHCLYLLHPFLLSNKVSRERQFLQSRKNNLKRHRNAVGRDCFSLKVRIGFFFYRASLKKKKRAIKGYVAIHFLSDESIVET